MLKVTENLSLIFAIKYDRFKIFENGTFSYHENKQLCKSKELVTLYNSLIFISFQSDVVDL